MGPYSQDFKNSMISKMLPPNAISATQLSAQVGVSQATLSRWLRQAATVSDVAKKKTNKSKSAGRRPQDWPAAERLRVVRETAKLEGAELGAYLRREGLHEEVLAQWRDLADQAALAALHCRKKVSAERRQIKELRKELHRKDRALAETAALLVLAKKARALLGDEDDDTTPRSGR